jgi:membrane protease YdiL (CAAX protease family)
VTKRRSGSTRKASTSAGKAAGRPRFALDPYFACLIFAAAGLGTIKLGTSPRLLLLWTTLLLLWLAFREGQTLKLRYTFADVGRGAGIGLAFSLPLMLLAFRSLATAIPILYVSAEQPSLAGPAGTTIFASLVLIAPLAEELFFRDVLQRANGLWIAIGLYAAAGVIFYLPTAGKYPAVLVAVSGATAVLGAIYAFLHDRYGLTVSFACHTVVNLVLLCFPALVGHLEWFAR